MGRVAMARRQPPPLEVRVRALARPARIPCLPTAYEDELLSSWLARCAISHRMDDAHGFANAVLRFEGMRPLPPEVSDIDIEAPSRLISALARCTALCEQELRQMMVNKGLHVLFQRDRDAYCPRCFQEDVEHRAIYRRRQWIDSWCLQCYRHRCLLGRYVDPPWERKPKLLPIDEQVRLGVDRLGTLVTFDPRGYFSESAASVVRRVAKSRWLNSSMLTSPLGRSLVLVCGSTVGEHLERVIFGDYGRKESDRWFDHQGTPIDWPQAQHPWSTTFARLRAAYIASVCWQAIDHSLGVPADTRAWLQLLSVKRPRARATKGRSGWRTRINPDWRDTSEEDAIQQEASALLRLRGTRYFTELARKVLSGM